MGLSIWWEVWKQASRGVYMLCASYGTSTPRRRTWSFLLINVHNAFNEENWTAMLWAVRYKWPSGAQFTFNCYCHWATIAVRDLERSGHSLHSKEGVTQGEPLEMIIYGILVLPLIQELRDSHPHITHPWHADDAGEGATLSESSHTFGTCRPGGHCGDTYQHRPRVSWSYPHRTWTGQRNSSGEWV